MIRIAPSEWYLHEALKKVSDPDSARILRAAVDELTIVRNLEGILAISSMVTGARLALAGKMDTDPGVNADVARLQKLLEAARWAEEVYGMATHVATIVDRLIENCADLLNSNPSWADTAQRMRELTDTGRKIRARCDREAAAILEGRTTGWLADLFRHDRAPADPPARGGGGVVESG